MLIKTYRFRLYLFYLVPLVMMVGLVARLYYVQVMDHDKWKKLADEQHYTTIKMVPMRGKIYDSNGYELAGSVLLDAGYLELQRFPKKFLEQGELLPKLAHDLADALHLNYDKVFAQLQGKYNKSPLLARDLREEDKVQIRNILHSYREYGVPLNAVEYKQENKRKYSRGGLAPHIVGFTQRDVKGETGDNLGAAGVERSYDEELRGKKESYVTRTSATGNPMEPADPALLESTYGHSIKLTINEQLQEVTQKVLEQGVEISKADSGVAVCYHVKTGEILSMANVPTFDINELAITTVTQTKNRAISDPIEPGSVMKIVTFTSLFDDQLMDPSSIINCEGGFWIIPGIKRPVKDSHASGSVPVSEVFQYSSNIGTIKAAQKFDKKSFYNHITRFGFGKKTGIDLPGESSGVLRNYTVWDSWSMSSLPMGYEMQVTAAQVVSAVGAIANKGVRLRPHVVKEIIDHSGNVVKRVEPEVLGQVASPAACRKVIDLMELVVEKGTAKPAKLEGYRVGGKTGTTKKVGKFGKYEDAYIAGFCGIAPIEDPEVCIYVYIDNPRGESFYGGSVAGPVFREIAREAMKVLRIPENKSRMPKDEFKIALEKVRNQIDKDSVSPSVISREIDTRPDDAVATDTVPEFRRLSLADAMSKASKAGLKVRISGSGTVVAQDPKPYQTIEGDPVVTLFLANSRDIVRQNVEEYNEIMQTEKEEVASVSTSSAGPITSLTLTLNTGAESVPVSTNLSDSLVWPVPGARKQAEDVETSETQYPDLDTYAQGPLDSGRARQSWQKFNSQLEAMKEQKKLADKNVPSEEQTVAGENAERPTDRPIPEIDGRDEMDPAAPQAPIQIDRPVVTKRRSERKKEESGSLYNM